jgi:cellobiose epimerase
MNSPNKDQLAAAMRRELLEDILPFWRHWGPDLPHGGFIGQMSNDLQVFDKAPKGLILNVRLLWTFSAVHRVLKNADDVSQARCAFNYIDQYFLDPQHDGYFWELDASGKVLDDKKKIYGQAFCVYALSEYYRT